ncbi:MAG: hypothetical protein Q7V57_16355 [Actinomycetota bacterium]|nr:hypothetical protein [Actinomycetota bacterium]
MSASIVALLAGCGGDSSSSPTSSAATSSTTNSSAVAPDTTLTSAVANPNHAVVTVTGAESISVNGAGGYCQYFLPATQEGLVYVVSAAEFGQSGWTLQVSGNSPTSVGVLLNATSGSYANDAALGNGTINAQADLHHADFDLDLVEVAHQDITVHVSGSIDCP